MSNGRLYKFVLAAVAVVLLLVSSTMQSRMNVARAELGLTTLPPLKNAPPLLAFTTVALGGFRGLIANALWLRAGEMQDADKYYDMVQLADWITALEPHFSQVWTYQAWNMAYNISVKFKDPEDRWHWLRRGIVLLRDRGIPLNPDTAMMYRELSWLYQHKMGQNLDDAHLTYKMRWAEEMQKMVGGRVDYEALEHPKTEAEKQRARMLREDYKLDPEVMKFVDKEYGPFDWRLPDAHAVYWAELFRQHSKKSTDDMDFLRRSIFQSMRMACFRGALSPAVTNVTDRNFMLWPNLDLFPRVNAAYESMIKENPTNNFQNAHRNDLKEVIPLLYINGRIAEATKWFNYLKDTYTNAFVGRQANLTLKDFVLGTVATDNEETDQNRVIGNLRGLFVMECQCLIRDNDDDAVNYRNLAKDVYEHYFKKIGAVSVNRLTLPSLDEIQRGTLIELLDPQNSPLDPLAQKLLMTKLGLKERPLPDPKLNAPSSTAPPPRTKQGATTPQ